MLADLDGLIEMVRSSPGDTVKACAAFGVHRNRFIFSNLFALPPSVINDLEFAPNWYGRVSSICAGNTVPGYTLLSALENARVQNERYFAKLETLDPDIYHTKNISSVRSLNLSDMDLNFVRTPFTTTFWKTLPNSSTNYDRKRAAYYLKRFFCDDLTPINVETPTVHAGGVHGSDKTCMACHYKLDPMAGFFRDLGVRFRDYSKSKRISFDDGASVTRDEYLKAWQPGPDTQHPFNVGYVRSSTNLKMNTYGSSIQDLYGILKTAPEVRRCLMKRLFSFFNSDAQSVDTDFVDYLTEQFSQDLVHANSTTAVKNAVKYVILSKAFAQSNPNPNTCYDYRPGHKPGTSAPCRVASIIAKNCLNCHHSTEQYPFLDLSHWEKQKDGKVGFSHLDADGKAIATAQTYQQILDRLSSTDPDERMPLSGAMPDTERAELYKWVSSRVGK